MTVILANKQLHTRPFILCLQVIVANMMFILWQCIPIVLTSLVQAWLFDSIFCKVIAILTQFILVWRWPLMFLLVLDRLLTVIFPFCYKKHANKIMKVLSVLLFFSSLLIMLPPLAGIGCYNFTQYAFICTISWQCDTVACYLYYVVTIGAIFITGAIAPIIMYMIMYVKARNLRKHLMSQSASEKLQYRRSEQRAQKTILLLFISLICLTVPGWLFYVIVEVFHMSPNTVLLIIDRVVANIYYCVPIADAVVILRNRDIKSAIRKNMKGREYNCCSRDTSQKGSNVKTHLSNDAVTLK